MLRMHSYNGRNKRRIKMTSHKTAKIKGKQIKQNSAVQVLLTLCVHLYSEASPCGVIAFALLCQKQPALPNVCWQFTFYFCTCCTTLCRIWISYAIYLLATFLKYSLQRSPQLQHNCNISTVTQLCILSILSSQFFPSSQRERCDNGWRQPTEKIFRCRIKNSVWRNNACGTLKLYTQYYMILL